MSIVPRGTRRQMVAQSFVCDELKNFEPGISEESVESLQSGIEQEQDQPEQVEQVETKEMGEEPDLTGYIFKTLESFGYPPRRLEEFEKEFVNEKIFAGGVKEVSIIIPDRYYGTRKRISDNDFNKIVTDIQNNFGLSFIDAERKDKKITINFTSQKQESPDDEIAPGDDLDEVYGQPKAKKVKGKTASTMKEMMDKNSGNLYDLLLKRNPNLRKKIFGE